LSRWWPRSLAGQAIALQILVIAVVVLAGSALALFDASRDGDATARQQVISIATALADGTLVIDESSDRNRLARQLVAFPGIGPWTAATITMRAAGDPDAFLDDLSCSGQAFLHVLPAIPLSRQALAILPELQPLARGGRYLFPSLRTRDRPMSDNTINAALRRMGYTSQEQTGHGFRTLASTLLNEQGFPPDVIELQLAHTERNKVRAAYNKAQRLPERREMMQAWADYLDGLRAGGAVTPIRRRASGGQR